jgi:hypothetical protein
MEEDQHLDEFDHDLKLYRSLTANKDVVPPAASKKNVDIPTTSTSTDKKIVGYIIDKSNIPNEVDNVMDRKLLRSSSCCTLPTVIVNSNDSAEPDDADVIRSKVSYEDFDVNEGQFTTVLAIANGNSTVWID